LWTMDFSPALPRMKKHQTKTEFEWHKKRAALIYAYMNKAKHVKIVGSTNATLTVTIWGVPLCLVRPPLALDLQHLADKRRAVQPASNPARVSPACNSADPQIAVLPKA